MARPNRPAMTQPISGRKTIAWYIAPSALHQTDVFDRDRAAVAVIGDENGKADRGLGGGHREHDQREHLADQIAEMRRERHQVDVDREQNQLDRHQDDDDVLAVEEDAEDAHREQDGADREIMAQPDRHGIRSRAAQTAMGSNTRAAYSVPLSPCGRGWPVRAQRGSAG